MFCRACHTYIDGTTVRNIVAGGHQNSTTDRNSLGRDNTTSCIPEQLVVTCGTWGTGARPGTPQSTLSQSLYNQPAQPPIK
uniref:Uncharacterized protein n=1 Tax=Arundo donax TaxID=35708 RepID=A0A0A8Z4U1_ARUDO